MTSFWVSRRILTDFTPDRLAVGAIRGQRQQSRQADERWTSFDKCHTWPGSL